MKTVQERLRWVMENCVDPSTGRPWKGKPLARAAGLSSESHVSMILNGEIKEPKRPALRGIAEAAGVPLAWLADGEGPLPIAGKRGGAPRGELRVERDPTPPMEAPDNAGPLVHAVTQALDKTRHLVTDATAVIDVLQNHLHSHVATDADLVEKARVWLDAAAALRREGTPVNAASLLDRVTLGKSPRLEPDENDAFQKEIAEIARKHGVEFGQARFAVENFLKKGREADEIARKGRG